MNPLVLTNFLKCTSDFQLDPKLPRKAISFPTSKASPETRYKILKITLIVYFDVYFMNMMTILFVKISAAAFEVCLCIGENHSDRNVFASVRSGSK